MKIEHFKSQLAGSVAAKVGITTKQAKQIVHSVVGLPSRETKKKLNLVGLGEVTVISQKATGIVDDYFTDAVKIPYEAVVKFNIREHSKTLIFRALEEARQKPAKRYEWIEIGQILTLGGLEGDPDTPVRRPKKRVETVQAEPEGEPDTNVRRPGTNP